MFFHPPAQANIWTLLTTDQTWISIWSLSPRNVCFLESIYQALLKFPFAGPFTVLSPHVEIWSSAACLEGCCDKELWKTSRIRAAKCGQKHTVAIAVEDNWLPKWRSSTVMLQHYTDFFCFCCFGIQVCATMMARMDFTASLYWVSALISFHSADIEMELSGMPVLINSFWPRDNINPYLVHLKEL